MKLTFTDSAWADYLWFQETQPHLLKRLNDLIKDTQRSGLSRDRQTRTAQGRFIRLLVKAYQQ